MKTGERKTQDERKSDDEVVLSTQTIEGHTVEFVLVPLASSSSITGGKTKHMVPTTGKEDARGKLMYSTAEEDKKAMTAALTSASITVKFDGQCCVTRRNADGDWVQYKRLDAKIRKKGAAGTKLFQKTVAYWHRMIEEGGELPDLSTLHKTPEGAISVLTDAEWIASGREKRMHLVPVGTSGKRNWQWKAFLKIKDQLDALPADITSMSFEAMGKKLQPCRCDPLTEMGAKDPHFLIPHGCVVVRVPTEMRTFDGLDAILAANPQLEGFVIHKEDGTRFKFRQDGLDRAFPPATWERNGFAADVVRHMGMADIVH